jgi:hypothetical protein
MTRDFCLVLSQSTALQGTAQPKFQRLGLGLEPGFKVFSIPPHKPLLFNSTTSSSSSSSLFYFHSNLLLLLLIIIIIILFDAHIINTCFMFRIHLNTKLTRLEPSSIYPLFAAFLSLTRTLRQGWFHGIAAH